MTPQTPIPQPPIPQPASPLPWRVEMYRGINRIISADGKGVCADLWTADAAFIVALANAAARPDTGESK